MSRDKGTIVARQNRDSNRAMESSFRRAAAFFGGTVAFDGVTWTVTVPVTRFEHAKNTLAITHPRAKVVALKEVAS